MLGTPKVAHGTHSGCVQNVWKKLLVTNQALVDTQSKLKRVLQVFCSMVFGEEEASLPRDKRLRQGRYRCFVLYGAWWLMRWKLSQHLLSQCRIWAALLSRSSISTASPSWYVPFPPLICPALCPNVFVLCCTRTWRRRLAGSPTPTWVCGRCPACDTCRWTPCRSCAQACPSRRSPPSTRRQATRTTRCG